MSNFLSWLGASLRAQFRSDDSSGNSGNDQHRNTLPPLIGCGGITRDNGGCIHQDKGSTNGGAATNVAPVEQHQQWVQN